VLPLIRIAAIVVMTLRCQGSDSDNVYITESILETVDIGQALTLSSCPSPSQLTGLLILLTGQEKNTAVIFIFVL